MSSPRRAHAAAVLIAVTTALTACGDNDSTTVTRTANDQSLGRPIGGQPPRTDQNTNADARATARAFLSSYLAVSYGHAKPETLRSATRSLRARLRAQAPRVPPGVTARHPRVVALRLESVADDQVRATATVDDGDVAAYPLFATLARGEDGSWVAISVGG